MEQLGSLRNYTGGQRNGITATAWTSEWRGVSLSAVDSAFIARLSEQEDAMRAVFDARLRARAEARKTVRLSL